MLSRWQQALKVRLQRLEKFTVEVIYGQRHDGPAYYWGGFLRGLSYLFEGIVRARQWLYRTRILRAQHLGCLVIVVGNLTVGGTGKTPVVEKLARTLQGRGRTVAILSRGYKSKREPLLQRWWRAFSHGEASPPRIVSNGQDVLLGSDVAGDEPYMLARNLPGVVVLTDKDRVKAGLFAIKHFGADTLILDDGYQYFRLQDHLQICLVDKTNPFGNGRVLPRGILREPVRHLRRADYVFLTKSDGQPDPELEALIHQYYQRPDLIECTHEPRFLAPVHGRGLNGHWDLARLEGKRVAALSAIAAPESFEGFLEKLGAQVVLRERFLDHHRFNPRELERIFAAAAAAGADILVTTEKDAVRVPSDCVPLMPFLYLRVEIKLLSGAKDFEEAVSRICFPRQAALGSRGLLARPVGSAV